MRRLPLPLLLALCALAACSSLRRRVTAGNAAQHLELAREEIAAGELRAATRRLTVLRGVEGLDPDLRARTEDLLETASGSLLAALDARQAGADDYLDLFDDDDLAPRTRARAGLLGARRLLEEGRPVQAAKRVREVEKELSSFADRALAGDVIGRAGLELVARGGRYLLVFRYASRGLEALDFLVVTYPFDARCPQAYAAMVEEHARRLDHDEAIVKAEDLIVYHPQSPEGIAMQVRLPELRLERLERDDNDRAQMLQARSELEFWLDRYAGRNGAPADEARARVALRACNRRLAENDLVVARFYERVDEPPGVRLHAERALASGRAAEAPEAVAEAERLLALHPEAAALPGSAPRP